jgi:hypothetical protein
MIGSVRDFNAKSIFSDVLGEYRPTGALRRRKTQRAAPDSVLCSTELKDVARPQHNSASAGKLNFDKMHLNALTGLYCDACDAAR